MQREIGSNFYLQPMDLLPKNGWEPSSVSCLGTDFALFSTGRSATAYVLDEIARRNPNGAKIALVPPFTCHTVIEPFLKAGYTVHCYPVNHTLDTDGRTLLSAAAETNASVILLHRYFGFDTLLDCESAVNTLREQGVVVIEDRTQCLYSNIAPLPADYLVGSLRKWAGLPDGGFAVCRTGVFEDKPTIPDTDLEQAKLSAFRAKYQYLFENIGEKQDFLTQYRKAETLLDAQTGYFTISPSSLAVQANLDIKALSQRRRENYKTLLNELKDCVNTQPLFADLPENVVPLYFPLLVTADRVKLQARLASASIYAPIVWPRADCLPPVCAAAAEVYEHILCIPIDQRYGADDMERIARCIRTGPHEAPTYPDVYYLPEWLSLYARRDGESFGYYTFRHPDGTVLYPYVKRQVPHRVEGITYYDIITPYGFNGPCIVGATTKDTTALTAAFAADFAGYCEKEHIIAEYVRFSPWLENCKDFGGLYELRDNNKTVAIDLSVGDIMMDEFSSRRRRAVRTAQKKGVTVTFDETGETVEEFYRLYQNTIAKNEIGAYYQFPLSFLQAHFQALGSRVCIANAKVDGKTISSSFILQCGDNIHYHLSANDYDMLSYQGNSLLLYEVAKRGKAFGCQYLHLGGVGIAEASLMEFKLSFTHSEGLLFYVGQKIQNKRIYDVLVAEKANVNSNYFPAYRG